MGIFDIFKPNIGGNNAILEWDWEEYKEQKKTLGEKLVLVDMVGRPVQGSVSISDKLFSGTYPDGTVFALYCNNGNTSLYLQMTLTPKMPNYTFISVKGGVNKFK